MLRSATVLAAVLLLATPASAGAPETRRSARGLEYSIRVPDGYDRSRGALLVVALHGVNEKQANFMRTMDSMPFLRKALVICPQAPGEGARWGREDVETVADLIREVQEEHAPPRTIAYGFSAGAFFTFTLGLAHPELIQGCIPHSGGRHGGEPDKAVAAGQAWYVIHGDADGVCPVSGSRNASDELKKAGVKVHYEELAGVAHVLDHPATGRGFEWLDRTLGPLELSDAETVERIRALEKSIKSKEADAVAKGFAALSGAPRAAAGKLASLCKAQLASPSEEVTLAAVALCGRLGDEGVAVLRGVSPDKDDVRARAAAEALGRNGSPAAAGVLLGFLRSKHPDVAATAAGALRRLGDPGVEALVAGLAWAEGQKGADARRDAINEALRRATGQSFTAAKDWKKWLAGRRR